MSVEIIPQNEFLSESLSFDKIDYIETHFKNGYINDLLNTTTNNIENKIKLVVSIFSLLNYSNEEELQLYYLKRFTNKTIKDFIELSYKIKSDNFIEYYFDFLNTINKYQLIYFKQNYIEHINNHLSTIECVYLFDFNSYTSYDFNKPIWTKLFYKNKINPSTEKKNKLDYINLLLKNKHNKEVFENKLYYIITRIFNEINKQTELNSDHNFNTLVLYETQIILFINLLIFKNNNNNESFTSENKNKIFMLSMFKEQIELLY
jgi:hypothetical protein